MREEEVAGVLAVALPASQCALRGYLMQKQILERGSPER